MSKKTANLLFPFKKDIINNGLERSNTVEKAITSSIKIFLMTQPNSRMGNPIGCSLTTMIQNTFTEEQLDNKKDDILVELENQFPEVKFIEFDLIQILTNLYVRIQYYTPITDIVDFEIKI